jgi:hypothetical protein
MSVPGQKNLITRSNLDEVNQAASGLVENLLAHINGSLSKQHGWNLVVLDDPTYDSDGNYITYYTDSGGDQWGRYRLQLTYNNTHYYVPLNTTTLAGKPALTYDDLFPAISDFSDTEINRAWVTDFSAQLQNAIGALNTDLLLPHTQKMHWEAHGAVYYQVIPQIVRDTAGHRVANYVAKIIFEGRELLLPCDTRIGGPAQPVRLPLNAVTTLPGARHNVVHCANDDNQWGYFYTTDPVGGTKPYTVTWEYNMYVPGSKNDASTGSGAWISLPLQLTADTDIPQPVSNGANSTKYRHFNNGHTLKIITNTQSNGTRIALVVRARWSNAAGSVYSNWALMEFRDTDGSWFFSGPDTNQSTYYYKIPNDPAWANGYFTPPPPPH